MQKALVRLSLTRAGLGFWKDVTYESPFYKRHAAKPSYKTQAQWRPSKNSKDIPASVCFSCNFWYEVHVKYQAIISWLDI